MVMQKEMKVTTTAAAILNYRDEFGLLDHQKIKISKFKQWLIQKGYRLKESEFMKTMYLMGIRCRQ